MAMRVVVCENVWGQTRGGEVRAKSSGIPRIFVEGGGGRGFNKFS
jgi:hypothetical protein